jgi:hypothetical protein
MIYFPETIDTISTVSPIYLHNTFFLSCARELTLCMLAPWSHEGVVFLDLLPSSHSVTSFLFPCLGSTDALCPRLGDPVPPPPKWRPHSQGTRTLPYRDPEHLLCLKPDHRQATLEPSFISCTLTLFKLQTPKPSSTERQVEQRASGERLQGEITRRGLVVY